MSTSPTGTTTTPRPAARRRRGGARRKERTARSVLSAVGKVLLGLLVAVVLAGAFLSILAFYTDLTFGVGEAAIAIAVAGLLVFLWTRWR